MIAFPKPAPYRSERYRRFVASLPCMSCGLEGRSQCAHQEEGKGRGIKSDDRNSFPLCADSPFRVGCHTQHSLLIDMTRDQRRELEQGYVVRMQAIARADGWDIFREAA